MLLTVTLDDAAGAPVALHDTAKRYLTSATGLVGISPTRDVVRVRPQAHGGIDDTRYTDLSTIVLEGECFSTAGIEDAFAEFRAIAKPMIDTLDTGPALLKWTEGATGLQLQKLVKLAGAVEPVLAESAPIVRYQAQLRAADPRAYSQTLTTATGGTLGTSSGGDIYPDVYPTTYSPGAGGSVAINNTGNRSTPPILRIYGGCTNPQIILITTGQKIAITGTIDPSAFLELDTQARTVRLNGTSNALYLLDAANTSWFDLPAGVSTVRAIASAFDLTARCDVLYRSAYA